MSPPTQAFIPRRLLHEVYYYYLELKCHKNQPNKIKPALYKLFFHFNGDLNSCEEITEQSNSAIKMGVAYMYWGIQNEGWLGL